MNVEIPLVPYSSGQATSAKPRTIFPREAAHEGGGRKDLRERRVRIQCDLRNHLFQCSGVQLRRFAGLLPQLALATPDLTR